MVRISSERSQPKGHVLEKLGSDQRFRAFPLRANLYINNQTSNFIYCIGAYMTNYYKYFDKKGTALLDNK